MITLQDYLLAFETYQSRAHDIDETMASGFKSLDDKFTTSMTCIKLNLPAVPISFCIDNSLLLSYRDAEKNNLVKYAIQNSCILFLDYFIKCQDPVINSVIDLFEDEPLLHFALKHECGYLPLYETMLRKYVPIDLQNSLGETLIFVTLRSYSLNSIFKSNLVQLLLKMR